MKKNEIDVVYVLGTGSNWNNNEIRFSLRSIQQNLSGYRNVFIVGEKPEWIKNVIHIPHPDEFGAGNADGNIIRKVLKATTDSCISDRFLFINDDHMVIKPFDVAEMPYFHKGDMSDPKLYPEKYFTVNYWRTRLGRTRDVLLFKGYTALHFDCHTPILFDKNIFRKVVEKFDYGVKPGYTMKSLYGNVAKIEPVLLNGEKKTVMDFYNRKQLNERLANCTFMSFNDAGLNQELKTWLMDHFPNKSRYEAIDDYKDMFWEIENALRTPDDKEQIRKVYIRYGREKNIVDMAMRDYTDMMHEKVLFKLKMMLK